MILDYWEYYSRITENIEYFFLHSIRININKFVENLQEITFWKICA